MQQHQICGIQLERRMFKLCPNCVLKYLLLRRDDLYMAGLRARPTQPKGQACTTQGPGLHNPRARPAQPKGQAYTTLGPGLYNPRARPTQSKGQAYTTQGPGLHNPRDRPTQP